MPAFHDLAVTGLEQLTGDAVALMLTVPGHLRADYRFTAGQHLTFAVAGEAGPARRTYSICSTPTSYALTGTLSVGVKILPDGVFSRLVADQLQVGDTLRVMTPAGRFSSLPTPAPGFRTSVAVVAGSGITPVLSIMTTLLENEPRTRFVLWYGSRSAASVMFAEEIADLKDRFVDRLQVFHMISSEVQTSPLLSGRIAGERLETILRLSTQHLVDEWFVCGPLGLIESTRSALLRHGVASERIHREVFFTGERPDVPVPPDFALRPGAPGGSTITFRLDGRSGSVQHAPAGSVLDAPAGSVLDAVLTARPDAPFACRNGVCGTCRMRVLSGTVKMRQNFALEPHDVDAGFRLACQSVPVSSTLDVDFDA